MLARIDNLRSLQGRPVLIKTIGDLTAVRWLFTVFICAVLLLMTSLSVAYIDASSTMSDSPSSLTVSKDSMSTQNCLGCHQTQTEQWKLSDHYMAMALPNAKIVLGNFNQQTATHYNQKAIFFMHNDKYMVTVFDNASSEVADAQNGDKTSKYLESASKNVPKDESSDTNNGETFTVKYTFGHYPLQQYLVETQSGRLQVIPFAWDSRPENEGGQRWYHNYSHEQINANDRLHWRQPLQNWNGMCADCHSDELTRNYNVDTNSFNTQYSGINVGCVSCHGVMDEHVLDGGYVPSQTPNMGAKHVNSLNGQWQLIEKAKTAVWKGPARNNEFMQTCYACHSLRSPLTDGFKATEPFLDQFSPSLITDPLYFADGQIKEEVYVYGSFLQSKMYSKGVNCLDCHDPHTMKIKIEGNGLCLQCHKSSEFDTPSHHKHDALTPGAQCVNCHMPDRIYMGVDKRRDHSFSIPRPDLSNTFNTPNACVDCHVEETADWAAKKLNEWFGAPRSLSTNQHNLLKLRHGQSILLQAHLNIVNDASIDVITRASALEMLQRSSAVLLPEQIADFVAHENDLIRLAAARAAVRIEPPQRGALITPLLSDKLRAIRVASAQALVGVPLKQHELSAFSSAMAELLSANETSAWRGEGRINIGSAAIANNDFIGGEMAYKATVKIDPYFAPGYINLADLYRAKQREDLVDKVLSEGIANNPDSADLAYSYGLHLVRTKKMAEAIAAFKQAIALDVSNPQFAYTYVLALDGGGQSAQALIELKQLIGQYQYTQSLKELGLYLAQKNNNRVDFQYFERF